MTADAAPQLDHSALASSFGSVADQYDRVRPGYPDDAITWMLPAGARRVVDLGAGTGKLTRLLSARGIAVTAVEPDAQMRQVLQASSPEVDVRAGSGEAIPVGSGE